METPRELTRTSTTGVGRKPNRQESPTAHCRDHAWRCERCDNLLGFIDAATRRTVRIKTKDSFVWIRDPKSVGVTCRGCGAYCEINDESELPPDPPPAGTLGS